MSLVTAPIVTLVSPLPASWLPRLWDWIQEAPAAHLDDTGPPTVEAFITALLHRQAAGERSWGIEVDGIPVGAIGYAPITRRLGTLHGICVTTAVCGTGTARAALFQILDELFASGVEKIAASYFADNLRVHRFLARAGFVEEGLLVDHTVRDGQPLSLRIVALFRPDEEGS